MRIPLLIAVFVSLGTALLAQATSRDVQFEAVSIKPVSVNMRDDPCQPPACYQNYYRVRDGRFLGTKQSVLDLAAVAYGVPSNRILAPEWAKAERYDIEATHAARAGDQPALMSMLRQLLAERFALRTHREQRPLPVYLLKRAREDGQLGPRLLRISDCAVPKKIVPEWTACGILMSPAPPNSVAGRGPWGDMNLAARLAVYTDGRPVLDETQFTGAYELRADWSSDSSDTKWPSLFTALREQLGLKLEPATRPLDVVVVDSVERPTPN